MPRYQLTLEYDGSPYAGWQRQENGLAVQEVLETAGASLTGGPAVAMAAGRTDSGVHALAMGAHIDLAKALPPDRVRDGLNAMLRPHPITVLSANLCTDDFHARFSCTGRRYLYRVLSRRAPPALDRTRVWHVSAPLHLGHMQEAALALLGRHDFTTFRSSLCQSQSPVKTLDRIHIETAAGDEVHFSVAAQSFLHNQVRSIVGTLVQVGHGRWPVSRVAEALAARSRAACGPVAPAHGLYFAAAIYDPPTDDF